MKEAIALLSRIKFSKGNIRTHLKVSNFDFINKTKEEEDKGSVRSDAKGKHGDLFWGKSHEGNCVIL